MADYDFAKIEKKLSKYLDEDRFQHTMGVMYMDMISKMHRCPVFFTIAPNAFPIRKN